MKIKLFLICSFVGLFFFYLLNNYTMTFVYLNPYSYTKPFGYISRVIQELDGAFKYAQKSSEKDGYNYKYIFFNAYGSGFIQDNNISNDLDYAVGIDLGKYKYNGKNSNEIAKQILSKMNSFNKSFNFYINTLDNGHTYITENIFTSAALLESQYDASVKNIENSIDLALLDKSYLTYTSKKLEDKEQTAKVDIPYVMKSGEILLEGRQPLYLYSDLVSYNPYNMHYMREISIIPEYFVTIDKDGVSKVIEIVPESFLGERLQLKRRLFASCVFVHNSSAKFLKGMSYIKNDEEYLFYRRLSFKRHLQEINNILIMQDRPIKLFKRLAQTADMMQPVLSKDVYDEIKRYTAKNLSNKNIILLNEYDNICANIANISEHPILYIQLLEKGKIQVMYNDLGSIINALEKNNVDKSYLAVLKDFRVNSIAPMLKLKKQNKVRQYREKFINEKYETMKNAWHNAVKSQLEEPEKLEKYIAMFNKFYIDAGFHKVTLCWLDNNNIGILEDSYTKSIKDLKAFAEANNLIDVNYKLIKESEMPDISLEYDVLTRYNTTPEEDKKLEMINKKFLDDKKNFNIKRKIVIIK